MKTLKKLATQRNRIPVCGTVHVDLTACTATNLDTLITVANDSGIAPGMYHGHGFDNLATRIKSAIPESDFPECPNFGKKMAEIVLSRDDFDCLQWVMKAQSTEETRYYLNGVCFDNKGAVATDGHRLHLMDLVTDLKARYIVPSEAMKFMVDLWKEYKTVPVLTFYESRLVADIGPARLITKYIDGTFPNYEQVIPKHKKRTTFNPVNLRAGLKDIRTMAKIAASNFLSVKCNGNGQAVYNAHDVGSLSFDISARFDNEIGFNPVYLADVIGGDCYYGLPSDPVKFVNGNRLAVLMPLRV